MSMDREFERVAAEWLDAGSDVTPPEVIDAVLLAARNTPQERGFRVPWRTLSMKNPLYAAAMIAVVVIAGAAAFYALGPKLNVGPPVPTATATPQVTPMTLPTAVAGVDDRPIPLGWSTYTSEQYGYIIGYPPDWSVDPADRAYDVDRDAADWLSPAMDDFTAQTGDVRMSVWAVPADQDTFETPTGVQTWIEQFCEKTGNASCSTFLDGAVPLCIEVRDCHPGLLLGVAPPFDQEVQAFFTGGIYNSQMVVVTIWRAADDPSLAPYGGGRQLMEAILMTMCVVPEEGHGSRRVNCG